MKTFETARKDLQLTVEFLNQWYPLEHQVIVYEAPFLPDQVARKDRIELKSLPDTQLNPYSTLVVPPISAPDFNYEVLAKFGLTADDLGK